MNNTIRNEFETNFEISHNEASWNDGHYEYSVFYKEPESDYSALRNIPFRLFIKQAVPIIAFDAYKIPTYYDLGIECFNSNGSKNQFMIKVNEDDFNTLNYDAIESGLINALKAFDDTINNTVRGLLYDNSSSNLLVE